MPATIPYPVRLRSDFRRTVEETIGYGQLLEHVIAVKDKQYTEVFHGKVDHSQPPWNNNVANAILDLHVVARRNEKFMRVMLRLPPRQRGSSDGNTRLALEHCVKLAEGCTDDVVRMVKQDFDRWVSQVTVILGQKESVKRLPREHGEKEPLCPWCQRDTLRQLNAEGVIKCIDPGCVDDEGRRPEGRLEYFHGEFILRWQDGIIGRP